MKEIDSITQ